ncbi:DnaJ domain-containing protein [Synechococcus sp. CS-1328]|uniref:DnaJ domain-containing protein n=1 Tax=Synechococcus sp. CS-1328 TaxID=2847976 RepID=UPI0037DA5D76
MGMPMTGAGSAPDHWGVLGLEPGSDAPSLKRAFRAQARRWHPDLNGNDPVAEERFKLVNEAYAVLSDPQRRRAWEAGEGSAAGASSSDPFATGFPDFQDYLETLFGRGRSRRREVEETEPMDAPGTTQAPGPQPSAAAASWGRPFGAGRRMDGNPGSEDPSLEGPSGEVTAAAPSPPPVLFAEDQETVLDLTPEQALSGAPVQLELADGTVVEVSTPPLAGDGWRLRLAGVAPGGGDHFLQLRVRTAEGLRVDGLRVSYALELQPPDAALGCDAVVPTLNGPVKLRVPPGSSSGRLLRLRGRGLRLGEQCGDQIVEVRVVVPELLSDAEQALYRRLRELAAEAASEQ